MSAPAHGGTSQYNLSNDGKGKFRASLARIYAEGMSAHANRNLRTVDNRYPVGTRKYDAFRDGWKAGEDLASAIDAARKESL